LSALGHTPSSLLWTSTNMTKYTVNSDSWTCSNYQMSVGLPGRHVEKTGHSWPISKLCAEPKIEGLDLYTYVCICIFLSGSSWNFQPDKSPQNWTVRFKTGHLATLDVHEWLLMALAGHSAGCRLSVGDIYLSVAYTSNASVYMLRAAVKSACNFVTIFVTLLHVADVCTC